jgi:hypothetical protein
VPQHDRVGPEAVEGHDRVYQGLALGDGGAFVRERDHVCTRASRRELERDRSPRRGFEEGQAGGLPGERARYASLGVSAREVEDGPEVLAGRVFDGQEAPNLQRRSPRPPRRSPSG